MTTNLIDLRRCLDAAYVLSDGWIYLGWWRDMSEFKLINTIYYKHSCNMRKQNIHMTKDELSSYLRQVIMECLSNKLVDLVEDNQNAKVLSNQQLNDTSILRKDDGNKPMTYDYLFDLHKGLPEEYFEPTDILYDPNEVAMYTIPNEVVQDLGLNEGLLKTYDSRKSIDYVCSLFDKKGYQVSPNSFLLDTPNDDCSIYGHIRIQIPLNQLNQEIDETLKQGFNTCG